MTLLRNPQASVPGLIFPLFFAAVNTAALERARHLPGFPEVDSFASFILVGTLVQGVMLASTTAGNDVAIDIQFGFFDRLVAAPVNRLALLLGRLAGAAVYGGALAVVFTGFLMLFGATLAGGLGALVTLVLVGALFGTAIGAISMAIGFRTGSVEEVNGYFPIFFTFIFLSSAFFPPELTGGWFEFIADINPISWMINGARHQVIFGWDPIGALQAVVVALGIAAICIAAAGAALGHRLRR
jgi:ABC-2 type transport system permease protein